MIGYYVHHHGSGHLHRALAIQRQAETSITGLSTLPRPSGWRGDWVQLPDDAGPGDLDVSSDDPEDRTAAGRLHYAPLHHSGLRHRMRMLSQWIDRHEPAAIVVDVSVEVALLARLHGVPVITMAQPGVREDPAHSLGYGISAAVLAPWPAGASRLWQVEAPTALVHLGAISRFSPAPSDVEVIRRRVVVLNGTGGSSLGPVARTASAATPEWDWVILDRIAGTWVDDPWPVLCSAEVIVSHCGQNAVAEIAAARRPAILIPQDRPFGEQRALAAGLPTLPGGAPATVLESWPDADRWSGLLTHAASLDGARWSVWNDGEGAARAAGYLDDVDGYGRTALTDARISA